MSNEEAEALENFSNFSKFAWLISGGLSIPAQFSLIPNLYFKSECYTSAFWNLIWIKQFTCNSLNCRSWFSGSEIGQRYQRFCISNTSQAMLVLHTHIHWILWFCSPSRCVSAALFTDPIWLDLVFGLPSNSARGGWQISFSK